MAFKMMVDFFARFKVKKKTSIENLEELDKKIKEIEKNKECSLLNERKIIGKGILYSIFLYIAVAILYIFVPNDIFNPVIARLLLLVIPVLLYFTRRFLKWFYIKRVGSCESKLSLLKEEKKKIIEEVKEKETYKKAREILERFSSEPDLTADKKSQQQSKPQQQVQLQQQQPQMSLPLNRQQNTQSATDLTNRGASPPGVVMVGRFTNNEQITRTLIPRPFIPQDRSTVDKILDFFIGDGPNNSKPLHLRWKLLNRYALICKRCCAHNGMALKEEFEFIAFRCAYCSEFNPSRKTKLNAPDIKSLLGSSSSLSSVDETASAKVKTDSEKEEEESSEEKIEEIAKPESVEETKKTETEKKNE